MAIAHFEIASLPVTPWKNGGGATREIACWPPGASLDQFGWRVSIATIASSGPFSTFAGVDRQIMLLEGAGVLLRSLDGRIAHRLDTPNRPLAFSGDESIECSLLGAASTDFNVMTRRASWRADVRVVDRQAEIDSSPHGLLLALQGNWELDGESLRAGGGLCWTDEERSWRIRPLEADARLVAVRFQTSARLADPKGAQPLSALTPTLSRERERGQDQPAPPVPSPARGRGLG